MDTYLTEEQQVEQLKALWHKYGDKALTALIVVLALIFGWKAWRQHQTSIYNKASMAYVDAQNSLLGGDTLSAAAKFNGLIDRYSKTPYATASSLMAAKLAIENKDFVTAQKRLQWVVDHGASDEFKQMARIRLARVLIEQKQAQAALEILAPVDSDVYLPRINEVRGDAHVALNEISQAKVAYRAALTGYQKAHLTRPLLSMKLVSLQK